MCSVDFVEASGFEMRGVSPLQQVEALSIPAQPVDRGIHDAEVAGRIDRLSGSARDCIRAAGLTSDAIDTVFLTGGSSRVPAVRAAMERVVPSARQAGGSDLLSVALGLTQIAATT